MSKEKMKTSQSIQFADLITPRTKAWRENLPASYVEKKLDLSTMVRFDMGEQCSLESPFVLQALQTEIEPRDLVEYPEPNCSKLKKEIAEQIGLGPEFITPGAGSDELINTIPELILGPDDESLIIAPTFFRFIEASLRKSSNTSTINLSLENDFQFNEQTTQKIIEHANQNSTKLIWLCSPSNPTGQVIEPNQIKAIVANTDAFVVVDEVFNRMLSLDLAQANTKLVKKHQNIILLRSLSKVEGVSGIRVGWGIAHPKTIDFFEQRRLPFNIPSISQKLAISALRDHDHLEHVREELLTQKNLLTAEIQALPDLQIIPGSQTHIFLLRHKHKDLFSSLLDRGILTADFRQAEGIQELGFVRITVQSQEKNQKLIEALQSICN